MAALIAVILSTVTCLVTVAKCDDFVEEKPHLNVESLQLHVPPLEELASVLQSGLEKSFANVNVSIVDCPDLTKDPFYLAAEGISGHPAIADVGGDDYLLPVAQRDKIYNLDDIGKLVGNPSAFMMGAGAGPFHVIGNSSEYITNIKLGGNDTEDVQMSYVVKYNITSQDYEMFQIPWSKDFAFLMNLFISEGKPGKVLKVQASNRVRNATFVTSMRESVRDHYGSDHPVAIGGAFTILKGQVTLWMQPGFSSVPLVTKADVMNWLLLYNMTAPLTCPSIFLSDNTELNAKLEHSHCFSQHGEGGHYVFDVTPDEVEYLGYYLPTEKLFRIDRPNARNGSETWTQSPFVGNP